MLDQKKLLLAWLGNSNQERKLMKKLSDFVKKGGHLVTTLSCPLGWVYNVIRRFTAFNIIKNETEIVSCVVELFDISGDLHVCYNVTN